MSTPALAAVSLGVVGHGAFTARIGRNETFNHAGNACGQLTALAMGHKFGNERFVKSILVMRSYRRFGLLGRQTIDLHAFAQGRPIFNLPRSTWPKVKGITKLQV